MMYNLYMKKCISCGLERPLDAFSPDKRMKMGRASRCKECQSAYAVKRRIENPSAHIEALRRWRQANPDRQKELRKKYYDADPQKHRDRARAHYHLHAEKIKPKMAQIAREKRSERREYETKRRRENPGLNAAKVARRRAIKNSAPGDGYAAKDVQILFSEQGGRCSGCMINLSSGFHVDHIRPLARGGENSPINLQLLCAQCNTSKGVSSQNNFLEKRWVKIE